MVPVPKAPFLTGAFHAGNGWEWGLLELLLIVMGFMGHSLIPCFPCVKRASKIFVAQVGK